MTRTSELVGLEDAYGARNYHPLDVVIERAEGAFVYDVDGNRYLDALAAYSAVNQGHAHPRIVATLVQQAHRVTLTSRAFRNDQLGPFCRELADLCGLDLVLPMNTGAEAVETAIKAARRWGYRVKGIERDRAEIVVFGDNFHGRTTTIVGFSSDEAYKADFGPFAPGFVEVPFGDLRALESAITDRTCAILIEPIQAEAGVLIPPPGYLAAAAELCRARNVLFIADEIQTGLGRTGAMFACDREACGPTSTCWAKPCRAGVIPSPPSSAGATCSSSSNRVATAVRTAAIRSRARSPARRSAS